MYAIVEIAGQQFKVEKGQQIFVNRLHEEEGSKVSFDRVLLIGNDGSTKVGAPTVSHGVGAPQRQQDYRFQEEEKKRISDF